MKKILIGCLLLLARCAWSQTVALPAATTHSAVLTWAAPTSQTDPVIGYFVYRAPNGVLTYTKLNIAAIPGLTYTDTTVTGSTTYQYYATSADSTGVQSVPSNTATAAIPAPVIPGPSVLSSFVSK